MNQDNRTIPVQKHGGSIRVTKAEFVSSWVKSTDEILNLTYGTGMMDQFETIQETVSKMAAARFEYLFEIVGSK